MIMWRKPSIENPNNLRKCFCRQVDVSTELKKSTSPAKSPNSQTSNHSSTSHSSNEKFLIKHLTAKTEPTPTIHRMDTGCTINSDEVQDGASSGRNSVISNFSDPDINTTSLQVDANQERMNTQVLVCVVCEKLIILCSSNSIIKSYRSHRARQSTTSTMAYQCPSYQAVCLIPSNTFHYPYILIR